MDIHKEHHMPNVIAMIYFK